MVCEHSYIDPTNFLHTEMPLFPVHGEVDETYLE